MPSPGTVKNRQVQVDSPNLHEGVGGGGAEVGGHVGLHHGGRGLHGGHAPGVEAAVHRGLQALAHQLLLQLVEVGNILLAPALGLPVPHVQVLLHSDM